MLASDDQCRQLEIKRADWRADCGAEQDWTENSEGKLPTLFDGAGAEADDGQVRLRAEGWNRCGELRNNCDEMAQNC